MITTAEAFTAARAHMSGRFQWGTADCCTAACDAFAALRGVDPMMALRGRYASVEEARRVMPADLDAFDALAASAGLAVSAPRPGAIGLVPWSGPVGFALVLCLGGKVAIKGLRGMVILPAEPVRAWVK